MTDPAEPTLPLIRTKLAPPKIGRAPVERRALIEQLDRRRSRKLHLLVGPAGSGKTSALVQWRRQLLDAGHRVAWYSAGADDDELRVASYLVEALRQAGAPIGDDGLALFQRSGGSAWQHLLAALVNEGNRDDGEIYLVIDNFQHLTSFATLQLLSRWIALASPSLHFVIATRASPPLELARLRAEDQLVEIGLRELRFDADETRRFVESQGLPALERIQLDNLQRMTDGWAAGLQLLTFSIRQDGSTGEFLKNPGTLSMQQAQALDDYLAQVVVGLLPPAEIEFLTRIAICRRFNRALCEALTDDPAAGDHLRKFESENLFVLPIDTADEEPWYRFHPLFSAFLEKRLRALGGDTERQLHRRAGQWFAAQQLQAEALRHAAQSGDGELLVELIDQYARRLTNAGQYFEYMKWCALAPADLLAQRVNASLNLALAQLSCGRLRDFERTIAAIEQLPQAAQADVRTELQLFKAYHAMRIDDPVAEQLAVDGIEQLPPPRSSTGLMLASVRCHQLVYAGQFESVRETARARFRGGDGHRQIVPLLDFWIGFGYLLEGRIPQACEQLQSVVEAGEQFTGSTSSFSGLVFGYLVEALYQADRVDDARAVLDQQLELVEAISLPDSIMYAHRVRAQIEKLDGDHASASRTLADLEERGLRFGADRVVTWSLHDQLLLALEMNEMRRADELCRRLTAVANPWVDEQNNVRSEIGLAAALGRAAHAVVRQPDAADAHAQVNAALDHARRGGRRLPELRVRLLKAQLLLQHGDKAQAIELAQETLQIAAHLGMRRLFADLPAAIREPLQGLVSSFADADLLAFINGASRSSSGDADSDEPSPAPDKAILTLEEKLLTVREREILNLLGRALSTKSIARELGLSPGTVKWHLRNIYGKLGAFSKEDALAKAREPAALGARAR